MTYLPDISIWNPKNLNNIKDLFVGCNSVYKFPDITKWNLSGCNNLNIFSSYDETIGPSFDPSNKNSSSKSIISQNSRLSHLSSSEKSDNNILNDNSNIETNYNILENEHEFNNENANEDFYEGFYN